jgi:hypothetical protein
MCLLAFSDGSIATIIGTNGVVPKLIEFLARENTPLIQVCIIHYLVHEKKE